jgi:hypothetical protein
MRPKQAQVVEDNNNRAAFVADHAGSKINFLCQRGNDQEQDYAKRNVHWLGAAIGEVSCPAKYMREASSSSFRRSVRYGFWLPRYWAALPAGTVAVGFRLWSEE